MVVYRYGKKICGPVSLLSLGCRRFPALGDNSADVIKNQIYEMIDYAYKNGVTYFDTTVMNMKNTNGNTEGISEVVLGEYFAQQGRNNVMLGAKLPWEFCKNKENCDHYFKIQTERLRTDYVDIYLLQGLNQDVWNGIKDSFLIDYMLELKKEGKIRYIGFSFDGPYEGFCDVVSYGIWDLCQIQMNVADMFSQVTIKGLKKAFDEGVDVFVTEPLRGGKLLNNIPVAVLEKYNKLGNRYSVAEWCFRWLYDSPYITSILCGMRNIQQLKSDIQVFQEASPDCLSDDEKNIIKDICRLYNSIDIQCTECGCCRECMNGLNIPQIVTIVKSMLVSNNSFANKIKYRRLTSGEKDIGKCKECEKCAIECSKKIDIADMMHGILDYLDFHFG